MGTFSVQKMENLPSTLTEYQDQILSWTACYDNFDCAYLQVPIDYKNLPAGRFKLRLLRHKALQQTGRIGSLVINPGGPGASGVEYAYNSEFIFGASLLQKYDIIGFDPRGVGESAPIKCLNNEETDASYAADSRPNNTAELNLLIQQVRDYANKCESRTRNLLHYGTLDSARDMDLLRATLKEKKLNYLGVSYGTYLGTLYAELFPKNVGRMVLDGAVSPNLDSEEQNLAQAVGFDTALNAFIADCYRKKECPLQQPLAAGRAEIISLFNKSVKAPLTSSSGRAVTDRKSVV